MSRFAKLIEDIENNDPQTMALINKIADDVIQQYDSDIYKQLDDDKLEQTSEIIDGYYVIFQYNKKNIMQLTKDGTTTQRVIGVINIISVTNAFTNKRIKDISTINNIKDKLYKKYIEQST